MLCRSYFANISGAWGWCGQGETCTFAHSIAALAKNPANIHYRIVSGKLRPSVGQEWVQHVAEEERRCSSFRSSFSENNIYDHHRCQEAPTWSGSSREWPSRSDRSEWQEVLQSTVDATTTTTTTTTTAFLEATVRPPPPPAKSYVV